MQIKAPRDWRPEDAKAQQVNAPPVHSRYRKFDLYRNVQQFFHIDNHAIQVSLHCWGIKSVRYVMGNLSGIQEQLSDTPSDNECIFAMKEKIFPKQIVLLYGISSKIVIIYIIHVQTGIR